MKYRLTVLWDDNTEDRIYEESTESKDTTIRTLKALSDVKRITIYSLLDNGDVKDITVI